MLGRANTVLCLLLWLCSFQQASAQSAPKAPPAHSPLKAGIASAILPGAGQVYNKKYWKVPFIYSAFATASFFAVYNGNVFFNVRKNLNSRVQGDSVPQPQFLTLNGIFSRTTVDLNQFSYDDLIQIQEDYRKYFTISCITLSAIYLLNILDAVVDAHLFAFDVGDDLSLQGSPMLQAGPRFAPAAGISLTLTLR